MLLAFHKPYGVLSQFTPEPGSRWHTLAEFGLPPKVYPIGRLDADSEGLLLLSDEPALNTRLLDPRHAHPRTYWAQVERIPSPDTLQRLAAGLVIEGRTTLPCRARLLDPVPSMPDRDPPIRYRKHVPDAWIELVLHEGRNRQVRKMTAAVGHPTLRLIRTAIGDFPLAPLPCGKWITLQESDRSRLFNTRHP